LQLIIEILEQKQSLCVGATYDVHLNLIGMLVVDFLFVLIELFR